MNNDSDSDSDYDEEAPQIVVVKKGDLTAEEAEAEQKRIEKGEQIYQIFTVQLNNLNDFRSDKSKIII